MSRLKEKYKEEVIPTMMRDYGYKSVMQVPRLKKIVVNIGIGEAIQSDLSPVLNYARECLSELW